MGKRKYTDGLGNIMTIADTVMGGKGIDFNLGKDKPSPAPAKARAGLKMTKSNPKKKVKFCKGLRKK